MKVTSELSEKKDAANGRNNKTNDCWARSKRITDADRLGLLYLSHTGQNY